MDGPCELPNPTPPRWIQANAGRVVPRSFDRSYGPRDRSGPLNLVALRGETRSRAGETGIELNPRTGVSRWRYKLSLFRIERVVDRALSRSHRRILAFRYTRLFPGFGLDRPLPNAALG